MTLTPRNTVNLTNSRVLKFAQSILEYCVHVTSMQRITLACFSSHKTARWNTSHLKAIFALSQKIALKSIVIVAIMIIATSKASIIHS